MQDQEKKFLGAFLYMFMLGVLFVAGVMFQFYYKAIPVVPEVIEVTKLVSVPQVIETTRIVEKECVAPSATPQKNGWFK